MTIRGTMVLLSVFGFGLGLGLGPGSVARADCIEGSRKTSKQERAIHKKVGQVLRAAFVTPVGWKKAGERPASVPSSVCKGPSGSRLRVRYRVSFLDVKRAKAKQKKMMAEMQAMAASGPPDPSVMQARMEAMRAMGAEMQRGTSLTARVEVNQDRVEGFSEKVKVPGGHLAYRKPLVGTIAGQEQTVVLFGRWAPDEAGVLRAAKAKAAGPRAITSAVLTVEASEADTRRFLASAKLESIAALIHK